MARLMFMFVSLVRMANQSLYLLWVQELLQAVMKETKSTQLKFL